MIYYRYGDLFYSGLPALAHGVNCKGAVGAGIAAEFRQRYPKMFESYRRRCTKPGEIVPGGAMSPGDVMPWKTGRLRDDGKVIFNLATQVNPGPYAQPWMITAAIGRMISMAWYDYSIPEVGLPMLGCGIGGLREEDLRAALTPYENAPVNLTVFRWGP